MTGKILQCETRLMARQASCCKSALWPRIASINVRFFSILELVRIAGSGGGVLRLRDDFSLWSDKTRRGYWLRAVYELIRSGWMAAWSHTSRPTFIS
jgi:hypothetical protein